MQALHEALRMELAPLGVQVVLVQLSSVLSALVDKSNASQLQAEASTL